MFSYLKYFAISLSSSTRNVNLFPTTLMRRNKIPVQLYSKLPNSSSNVEIIDVNINQIMTEDEELALNYNYDTSSQTVTTRNLDSGTIAPVDINPWIDEEYNKGGTVDMEYVEKEEIHYPEPPKERTGYYEFEGLNIWLPKRMLSPATYRYRLTEEEQQTLPDDIRICKFSNFKPTS